MLRGLKQAIKPYSDALTLATYVSATDAAGSTR